MRCHWSYLKYILRHRWYVFLECCKFGIPWRGLIHDWHKFLPSEWFPYVHYFYGDYPNYADLHGDWRNLVPYKQTREGVEAAFDFAWLLHQKRARHHWQWWILPEDDGGIKILSMSNVSRREMLCDWKGAGKVWGKTDTLGWYEANQNNMQLHPDTRKWIEEQLGGLGQ